MRLEARREGGRKFHYFSVILSSCLEAFANLKMITQAIGIYRRLGVSRGSVNKIVGNRIFDCHRFAVQ